MILLRIFRLFANPPSEWGNIRDENTSVLGCYTRFIIWMAAIPPISGFIGTTVFGWQFGAGPAVKLTTSSAAMMSIAYYVAMLVAVFCLGLVIHWMGQTYDAEQPLSRCIALAAYTATPLFIIGIMELYPILWLNFIVGLPALAYCVRLLYTGVPIMMGISNNRGFLFSSAILAFGLVALVALLGATALFWGAGLGPEFVDASELVWHYFT